MRSTTQAIPSEKCIDKTDFIDIIGTYVPLSRDNDALRGYCPLCHNDAHRYQGFLLFPDKLEWRCEGCGEEGDVYRFFEKLRHLSHDEAIGFTDMLITNQIRHKAKSVDAATLIRFPKPLRPVSKPEISVSEASVVAVDTAKSEILEEVIDVVPVVHTKESFVSGLLKKFEGRDGYRGIAVIDRDDNLFLGSTMEDLMQRDIEIMDEFMKSTLPGTQAALEEYEIGAGNTVVTMEVEFKSEDLKFVWIPMNQGLYPCNILLLLKKNVLDSLYVMQLKSYFRE